jgi:hypothetical protein
MVQCEYCAKFSHYSLAGFETTPSADDSWKCKFCENTTGQFSSLITRIESGLAERINKEMDEFKKTMHQMLTNLSTTIQTPSATHTQEQSNTGEQTPASNSRTGTIPKQRPSIANVNPAPNSATGLQTNHNNGVRTNQNDTSFRYSREYYMNLRGEVQQ